MLQRTLAQSVSKSLLGKIPCCSLSSCSHRKIPTSFARTNGNERPPFHLLAGNSVPVPSFPQPIPSGTGQRLPASCHFVLVQRVSCLPFLPTNGCFCFSTALMKLLPRVFAAFFGIIDRNLFNSIILKFVIPPPLPAIFQLHGDFRTLCTGAHVAHQFGESAQRHS